MARETLQHRYNGWTFPVDHSLVTTECWCGIKFAIPQNLERWMRDGEKRSCYCPVGHTMVYRESNAQRLERERRLRREAEAEAQQERASKVGYKRAAARARNERDRLGKRAKAGVCPCCNRTVKQLARHMETKHPDYEPTNHREELPK